MIRTRLRRALLLVAFTLAACTETVQLQATDPLAGLVALAITPDNQTLTITDLAAPPVEIDYRATGTFADGTQRDVTSLVSWEVDNPAPGGIGGQSLDRNKAQG